MKVKKKVSLVSRGIFNPFTFVKDAAIKRKRDPGKKLVVAASQFLVQDLPSLVRPLPSCYKASDGSRSSDRTGKNISCIKRPASGHFPESPEGSSSKGSSSKGSITKQLKREQTKADDQSDDQDMDTLMDSSLISASSAEPPVVDIQVNLLPLSGDNQDKLLILESNTSLAITEGSLSITLLFGHLALNGYQMAPMEQISAVVGLTCNYIVLTCELVTNSHVAVKENEEIFRKRLQECLSDANSDIGAKRRIDANSKVDVKMKSGADSKVDVEKVTSIIESIKKTPSFPNVTIVRVKRKDDMRMSWLESVMLNPKVIYNQDAKPLLKLSSATPAVERCNQWQAVINEHNLTNLDKDSTLTVIGPSNCGKTSFLKQLINNLACRRRGPSIDCNQQEGPSENFNEGPSFDYDAILFIDLDIGQSELSLPGSVSFSLISLTPLISAPFISVMEGKSTPIKSVSVGSVDPSIDPDQYIASVIQLLEHVNDYVNEYLNEHQDKGLPILINTMGWIRGIGRLLTIDVIRLTRPTILIQLKEERANFSPDDSISPEDADESKDANESKDESKDANESKDESKDANESKDESKDGKDEEAKADEEAKHESEPIPDFNHDNVNSYTTPGWSTEPGFLMPPYRYIKWTHASSLRKDKMKAKNRTLQQLSYLVSHSPEIMYKPIQAFKRHVIDLHKIYFKLVFPIGPLPVRLIPHCLNFSWVQLLIIEESEVSFTEIQNPESQKAESEAPIGFKVINSIPSNNVIGCGVMFVNYINDAKLITDSGLVHEKIQVTLVTPEDETLVAKVNCIVRPHGLSIPPELHAQSLQFV